jgi:hypothetical protein
VITVRMADLEPVTRAIVAAALAAERAANNHRPDRREAVSGEMSAADRPAPGHHPGRRVGSGSEAA